MSETKPINWTYWRTLQEVRCYQACLLSLGINPKTVTFLSDPDFVGLDDGPWFLVDDTIGTELAERMEMLVSGLTDRKYFSPGMLSMHNPNLHRVRLEEFAAWAKSVAWPIPNELGAMARAKEPPKSSQHEIDWTFWKGMVTVKLWEACALMVGLDPDKLKRHPQAWMGPPGAGPMFDSKCFPSGEKVEQFDKARRLAESAVSYMNGPIFPQGQPYAGHNAEKDVLLMEVAAFFVSREWPTVPATLQSLAGELSENRAREPIAANVPATGRPVQKQKAQELRIIELLNAQGYSPASLAQRAAGKPGPKSEIKTLALGEPALFTAKTFDTAWQRLRDAGQIAGAD